jgi:hypothetical protein
LAAGSELPIVAARFGGDSASVGRSIRLNSEPSLSAKKICETLETLKPGIFSMVKQGSGLP